MPHPVTFQVAPGVPEATTALVRKLEEAARRLPEVNDAGLDRIDWLEHLSTLWLKWVAGVSVSADTDLMIQVTLRGPANVYPAGQGWKVAKYRLQKAIESQIYGLLATDRSWDGRKRRRVIINMDAIPAEFSIVRSDVTDAIVSSTFGKLFGEQVNRTGDYIKYVGTLYRSPQRKEFRRELDAALTDPDFHCTVITGMPRTGKSYTAFYVLFKAFVAGCDVFASSLSPSDQQIEKLLDEIDGRAGDTAGAWVFIEDPFGATGYAANPDRLDRLCAIFERLKQKKARLLLTSRDGIWEEATRHAEGDASAARDQMRIVRLNRLFGVAADTSVEPIYHNDILNEMIVDYAALSGAEWVRDGEKLHALKSKTKQTDDELILPADIVVWCCLPEVRKYPEQYVRWLRNAARFTEALAEDIHSLFFRPEMRVALILPQILLLSKKEGARVAEALGVKKEWVGFESLIDDRKPAKYAEYTHSNLVHCQLFQSDWGEAFSNYARSHQGLSDLGNILKSSWRRWKGCGDDELELLLQLVRFHFFEFARRDAQEDLVPDPWLTKDGAGKIQKLVADRKWSNQRERMLVLCEILPLTMRRHKKDRVKVWTQLIDRMEKASGNPAILSVIGYLLGDLARLPFNAGVLDLQDLSRLVELIAEEKPQDSSAATSDSSAFQAALRTSLVLGAVVEPLGEQGPVDAILQEALGRFGNCKPKSASARAAWLTWFDILLWKIGDIGRFISEPELEFARPGICRQDLLGVVEWLRGQLEAQQCSLRERSDRDYCFGWILFSMLWHNDWNHRLQREHVSEWTDPIRRATQAIRDLWSDAMRVVDFNHPSTQLWDGFFDNAAYHCTYHQFQATEWARRTAVRPSNRELVRLGSETHHERGLVRSRADDLLIWMDQDKLWRFAVGRAEERLERSADRTWGAADASNEATGKAFQPRGCFFSIVSLRGCRAANKHEDESDKESDIWFHQWLRARLHSTGGLAKFDRAAWEVVLDLLRQGFNPISPEERFPAAVNRPVSELWDEVAASWNELDSGHVLIDQVNRQLETFFTPPSGSSSDAK